MILQNDYWYDIVPTTKGEGRIDGKWLFFDETKKLHTLAEDLDRLVESGQIRAAKIARKLPAHDPFPEKPCVLCVFTSADPEEKETVRALLQSEFGINVTAWKSEQQTKRDWEEGGWLQLQFESNQLKREIEAGLVTNQHEAQQKLSVLAEHIRALAESVKDPQRKLELELNAIREVQIDINDDSSRDTEDLGTIKSQLTLLAAAITEINKKMEAGGIRHEGDPSATDPQLVFIIMPFDESHIDTYDAIKRAIERTDTKLRAVRVDEQPGAIAITDEIHRAIRKAALVVCDLTAERPNVYYELGFAKGIGKRLICIAHEGTQIHFDVYGIKILFFRSYRDLEERLSKEATQLLAVE